MSEIIGRLYLAGAFILAGSSVVSLKYLSGPLGPFSIISLGLVLTLAGLWPLVGRRLGALRHLEPRHWLMLLVQALFGIFLFRLLLLAGLERSSAAEAGLLTGAAPAVTALLAWLILREPPQLRSVLGVAATVAGIGLIQGWGRGGLNPEHLLGHCLILGAAASESLFNVFSRKSGLESSAEFLRPLNRTFVVAAMALLMCLGPCLAEQPLAGLARLDAAGWLALLWQGLAVGIISYIFFFAGIQRCDCYAAAAFSGLMPLSALLFSWAALGEVLSPPQLLGGLGIIAGLNLISGRRKSGGRSENLTGELEL